jgi:hypothetical protein
MVCFEAVFIHIAEALFGVLLLDYIMVFTVDIKQNNKYESYVERFLQ